MTDESQANVQAPENGQPESKEVQQAKMKDALASQRNINQMRNGLLSMFNRAYDAFVGEVINLPCEPNEKAQAFVKLKEFGLWFRDGVLKLKLDGANAEAPQAPSPLPPTTGENNG